MKFLDRPVRIADRIRETSEARAALWQEFVRDWERVPVDDLARYVDSWQTRYLAGERS
jgi:hypothetical protein